MLVLKKLPRLSLKCSRLDSLKIIKCLSHSLDLIQPRVRQDQFIMQFKQKEKIPKVANSFPYQMFKSPKPSYPMQISVVATQQLVVTQFLENLKPV
jgi:hypothetical protein